MTVYYATKYALTTGIKPLKLTANDVEKGRYYFDWVSYVIGKDLFPTMEEAKADALKRTQRRIGSLVKQVEKLEKLLLVFAPAES